MLSEEWTQAIVQVGGGRGFVVKTESEHLVITAGHCLPQLPPCLSFSYTHERTYARLLGRIGKEPSVWTECVFVDPVADLAVLGRPDGQELYDEARAYDALMEAVSPLPIGKLLFRDHRSLWVSRKRTAPQKTPTRGQSSDTLRLKARRGHYLSKADGFPARLKVSAAACGSKMRQSQSKVACPARRLSLPMDWRSGYWSPQTSLKAVVTAALIRF